MLKTEAQGAVGGPDKNSGYIDLGDAFTIPATTASTTVTPWVIDIVPQPDVVLAGGDAVSQIPASGAQLERLMGAQVAFTAALAASAVLTFGISVYRAGAQLGSDIVLGWKNGGGGTPAFTAWVAQSLPWNTANTTAVQQAGQSGKYNVLLQAGDVLALTAVTSSGTVSIPVGLIQPSIT